MGSDSHVSLGMPRVVQSGELNAPDGDVIWAFATTGLSSVGFCLGFKNDVSGSAILKDVLTSWSATCDREGAYVFLWSGYGATLNEYSF